MTNKNGKAYGPLQIVHDFKFTALNVKDDYSLLDTMDFDKKLDYIKSRLDRLKELGYGGAVMNVDYNDYLRKPEAFDLFFACAEYARSIDLRVWIYDEQYYPSGSAGGITLEGHPELEAAGLFCISKNVTVDETVGAIRVPSPLGYSELKYAAAAPIRDGKTIHSERIDVSGCKDLGGGLCFSAPVGEWRVWCFFLRPLYELTKFCQGTRASRRYISVFNKRAIERFYKVTFEDGYNRYAKGKLGEVVDAIFTDEPYSPFYSKYYRDYGETVRTEFPSSAIYDKPHRGVEIYPYVPWEMTLPERFEEKHGHPVIDYLPDLFDETEKTMKARIDFYTLLSEMSLEAFPQQMTEKLSSEGVALSGHYFGEEGMDYHPIFFGDILEHLSTMSIPGCDCLWSDLERLRYSMACKLASSAAHIVGKDKVMIEASNMVDVDQNITLARLKAAMSTMFVHGINVITSYYSEKLLPDADMQAFTKHVSSLTELFEGGKYRINTLLYYPFENLCADRTPMGITEGTYHGEDHLGISRAAAELTKHQVQFDLINKQKLLSCHIDGCLITPNGERVKYVVIPNVSWLDSDVENLLKKAESHGVKVLFYAENGNICNVDFTNTYLNNNYPECEINLANEDGCILATHRAFDTHDLFMLVNTEQADKSINISLSLNDSEELYLVDIPSGEKHALAYTRDKNKANLTLDITALETVVIGRYEKNRNGD